MVKRRFVEKMAALDVEKDKLRALQVLSMLILLLEVV
jgi:hypothetical protein